MPRKKPDMLWVLVFLFGVGVITTSYAQSLWSQAAEAPPVHEVRR